MNENEFGDAGRQLGQFYSSLASPVGAVVFLVGAALSVGAGVWLGRADPPLGITVAVAGVLFSVLLASSMKVANQWERGIVLRLGQFQSVRGPGLFFVVPILDRVRIVDMRVLAADIPRQEAITRDNVPVRINGALFFQVASVEAAVMKIQDYYHGILLLAQTALRDVVGGMLLDELLSERDRIGKLVEDAVEKESQDWGLKVAGIRLMDIDMPEDLKRIMSRQAGAEREKRATITKAEGDRMAAENLAAAASTMLASPGSMQLRTLQTIDGLGPSASNTVILAIPVEFLELAQKLTDKPAANG